MFVISCGFWVYAHDQNCLNAWLGALVIMLKYGYKAKLKHPWVCVYLKLLFCVCVFFILFLCVAIGTKDAVSMGFSFVCVCFLYRYISVCRMKDSRADWFAVYIFHILQKTGSYLNA